MRRLLVLLAAVFAPAALAAPFIVADVVAGVTQCGVFVDAQPKVVVTASALLCKWDASGVAIGAHAVTMTAITVADPVWGTQESVKSAPLNFTRPGVPQTPSTPRLTAQ